MDNEEPKRYRGQRGPDKVPRSRMVHVSMRLPAEVVDYFGGSTINMREALVKHVTKAKAMEELTQFSNEVY